MASTEHHAIIVIGAGLSGLYTAWKLQQQQQDVIVLEARDRLGGRILSLPFSERNEENNCVDMGPAWVWPSFQPRLKKLVTELDIRLFKQYIEGYMLYELGKNNTERYSDQSSHGQSYRIGGGTNALINSITSNLTKSTIRLSTQVISLKEEMNKVTIEASQNESLIKYTADKVVLALPPRISQQSIQFDPPLSDETSALWQSIPTWMAAHCKILFIYNKPFWRQQKFSGEVLSRYGPLSEIYDGSPVDETYFALTSFVKLDSDVRKLDLNDLVKASLIQLKDFFGEDIQKVEEVHIKDWSIDEHTATPLDLNGVSGHPQYPTDMPRSLWDEKIILAGTEVAREHGGYIEGAIESADEALDSLI